MSRFDSLPHFFKQIFLKKKTSVGRTNIVLKLLSLSFFLYINENIYFPLADEVAQLARLRIMYVVSTFHCKPVYVAVIREIHVSIWSLCLVLYSWMKPRILYGIDLRIIHV